MKPDSGTLASSASPYYCEWNVCFAKLRDKPTPGKKYHYIQIGKAFSFDLQRFAKIDIRIDAVPINFDGKLVLFES
jgi:hypothetical protein